MDKFKPGDIIDGPGGQYKIVGVDKKNYRLYRRVGWVVHGFLAKVQQDRYKLSPDSIIDRVLKKYKVK
jgi:hypothetical protein